MKKIITTLILISIVFICAERVSAAESYKSHLNKGLKKLEVNDYTEALREFQKSFQLSKTNLSVRKSLIYTFINRADRASIEMGEWGKAANDYRSALFYLKFYLPETNDDELNSQILPTEKKLNECMKKLSFKKNSKNRFLTANLLEIAGEYAAAGYEYKMASADKNLKEQCETSFLKILNMLGYK